MDPLKVETFDPRWRNVHLRSIYNEAEEYNVGRFLRRYITLSSLYNLLLGSEPFVPSWVALDGDTKDPAFWVETLTKYFAHSNEYICASAASFHDLLEVKSLALCTAHALAKLRKDLHHDSHNETNQTPNTNGKRPRPDTNGPPAGNPRSASTTPKDVGEPKLTLENWLKICDGTRTSWKDTHAEWNNMIRRSKAAKITSWENLKDNWEPQGLTLSLGYITDATQKFSTKCTKLISELSKGRPQSNNPPSYIPIVRNLGNLWPAAKNTEFERCIQEVVNGNFRPQATEQLLGYIRELAQIIKGSTVIAVTWKSREAELKKAELLCRRQARQLQKEQREKEVKQREELCRQAEEDFGRDRLALDDERDWIDMASANIKDVQAECDERGRTLSAKEASYAEREGSLTAKEASCKEMEATTAKTKDELQKKLNTYVKNQKNLLEGQRRLKKGDDSLARRKAVMAKQDIVNTRLKNILAEKERELEVRETELTKRQAWMDKKGNASADSERQCATKEADLNAREEALRKEQSAVTSEQQELETQKSALRQEQALHQEADRVLKGREEELVKERGVVLREMQGVEAQKLADLALHRDREKTLKTDIEALAKERVEVLCDQKNMATERETIERKNWALRAEQAVISRKQEESATARKTLEDEKSALKAEQAALSRRQQEASTTRKTLEDEKLTLTLEQTTLSHEKEEATAAKEALKNEELKLRAKQALYEEEKMAWREQTRKIMEPMQEMHKNMNQMQGMQKAFSAW